jgi:hypothetical protein
MIHRPPETDFQQFKNMREPEFSGGWIVKLIFALVLGAAISGIITGFRGWSSHSHID